MDCFSVATYKLGRGWNFSSRSSRGIIIFMATGFLSASVAMGSAYWEQVTNEVGSAHSGLWKVCILNKCDQFVHHLLYEWFHVVQTSWIISLLAHVVASFLYLAQMFTKNQDEMPWKLFKLLSLFCCIASVSLSFLTVLLYGINQGSEPNSLSWGYGFAILTSMLQLAIVVLFIIEYSTTCNVKTSHRRLTGSQEMVLLQYPRHLEDEHVLYSSEVVSAEKPGTSKEENDIEVDGTCDVFTPSLNSSSKQPSKTRKISVTSVRERSATLDNSYNSCNFPD